MSSTKKDRKTQSVFGKKFQDGQAGERLGAARFANVIAVALRQDYGGTHAAAKTVAGLTGANERAAKNWLHARNGPSGEFLILLCRHSDQVLEAVLSLANRSTLIKAKKLADAKDALREILRILEELEGG